MSQKWWKSEDSGAISSKYWKNSLTYNSISSENIFQNKGDPKILKHTNDDRMHQTTTMCNIKISFFNENKMILYGNLNLCKEYMSKYKMLFLI